MTRREAGAVMQAIHAVCFEPVGCLAEFAADEFNEIAARVFNLTDAPCAAGSEAYWRVLELLEQSGNTLTPPQQRIVEDLEVRAAEKASMYEDVVPALAELKEMNLTLLIASSLSTAAVSRFLERFSLNGFFSAVWTRDNARGVKTVPLARAMETAALEPEHVMSLADTVEGLTAAKELRANAILMFNDYEEGKRLAMHRPTGAIVSLHELPAAIRFVAEGARVPRP